MKTKIALSVSQTVTNPSPSPKLPMPGAARVRKKVSQRRSPGRPTTQESDAIGDVLPEAALRCLTKLGFKGTTMETVAKEAEVARITVYRRFGDKRELFRQVSNLATQRLNAYLREGISLDATPETVLRSLILRLLDAHLSPRIPLMSIMKLAISESDQFPEIARTYWDALDYGFRPITEYLELLQKERIISVPNPRDAAWQLTGLAVGGVRYLLVRPSMAPSSRDHWVDSVYTTFARAWGLDTSHLAGLRTVDAD